MTQRISLSIEQWIALREGGMEAPPIWFTVVGGSMSPLIRKGRDQVMLVGVEPEEIKVGDIVLFPGHFRGGDYCLHRVYRLDGDMVQTFGDGNPGPDGWMARSRILGRAKLIRRGNRTIDCDDPRQRRRAARWCALWRVRPLLMLPHRFAGKAARVAKCVKAQVDEQTLSQRDEHGGGLPVETQCLIYLVACAVNRIAPEADLVADMDLDAVYQVASQHMLAATIAPALEAAGVKDDRFSSALQHSVLKNATMDAEMDALFAEMDAAGIWHMPLKGIVLQHMYPVYGMRQMSDHDILFDAVRADDVRAIMEGLGFSTEHFGESNHDVYHKEPVSNFEMHRALFGPGAEEGLYEYYRGIEGRLLGNGCEKRLGPEDFYLYVTAHEYKHYANSGTGLRSLLDTYVYLRATELDMGYVAAEAEKMGMAEFEAANRSLAQHLFSGQELTEDDGEMLEYVMSSGVYGTIGHRVENAMAKNGYGKLRYALDRFFVPVSRKNKNYENMAGVYPLFYEHKALLPLLPFYRTLRAMKNGKFKAEARAIRDAKR